ncbi:MAG: T9SS type A sorting domain-containing protein [Candidatus Cloacimonadota bacterium]|nr:T9SS type A sorting domain-containing protein [Candidatus Cloacimonadota bacterium]
MKIRLLLILLFILPLFLCAQQATSTNYKLLDYGLFNGYLTGNNEPESSNYIAEVNTVGALSEDKMESMGYDLYSGFVGLEFGEAPLPVILSSFTVTLTNNKPRLNWVTQTEQSNAYWNVYRSISQNLGQAIILNIDPIEGAGTSSEPTEYVFIDQYGIEGGTTYWYWIESISYDGNGEIYGPVYLTIPPGIDDPGTPQIPQHYGLYQNFPNPFNPTTLISFGLKNDCMGELTIYNIKGQKIKTLFMGNIPGNEIVSVVWNSRDDDGKEVASGVYLYQLITDNKEKHLMKMLLVK